MTSIRNIQPGIIEIISEEEIECQKKQDERMRRLSSLMGLVSSGDDHR
jgi:hypothetical protein